MLRSLYAMLDYHIAATDGELGRVQDFLFDDESWIVRYPVVETGAWGNGERVLVVPFALGFSEWKSKQFSILLTRNQLRASPPLECDMPISLQHTSGLKQPGGHLRSMREVFGYRIHSSEGEVGSIEDFIVEDSAWAVRSVVVTLSSGSGPVRSIVISPDTIRSISWQRKIRLDQSATQQSAGEPCLRSERAGQSGRRATQVRLPWKAGQCLMPMRIKRRADLR